jgi:hypothetical protein
MKHLALAAAVSLIAVAPMDSPSGVLRVRTSAELAPCVERALSEAAVGTPTVVEIGDPTTTDGADVIVGYDDRLTRTLESGRADDRFAVPIGVRGGALSSARNVIAAPVGRSLRFEAARALVDRLAAPAAQQRFAECAGLRTMSRYRAESEAFVQGAARFAQSVVEWWMPACSLHTNAYTDPNTVLGAPDAENVGGRGAESSYRGMISLGQGGYVVVDMGQTVTNRPGNDVRVYQFTSMEPVSLYGGDAPTGPFTLIAFRRRCGTHVPGAPNNWEYCDFDLAEGGLASARYLKVEDGELYPCLSAGTDNEGADIDAVELLNQ